MQKVSRPMPHIWSAAELVLKTQVASTKIKRTSASPPLKPKRRYPKVYLPYGNVPEITLTPPYDGDRPRLLELAPDGYFLHPDWESTPVVEAPVVQLSFGAAEIKAVKSFVAFVAGSVTSLATSLIAPPPSPNPVSMLRCIDLELAAKEAAKEAAMDRYEVLARMDDGRSLARKTTPPSLCTASNVAAVATLAPVPPTCAVSAVAALTSVRATRIGKASSRRR